MSDSRGGDREPMRQTFEALVQTFQPMTHRLRGGGLAVVGLEEADHEAGRRVWPSSSFQHNEFHQSIELDYKIK
jgi:hypothetical protein